MDDDEKLPKSFWKRFFIFACDCVILLALSFFLMWIAGKVPNNGFYRALKILVERPDILSRSSNGSFHGFQPRNDPLKCFC